MNAADLERANSWIIEIVGALIEDVGWRIEGSEHQAIGHGGLSVNTYKGAWFQHSTGKGGYDVLSLVKHLRNCNDAVATQWVQAFLKAHPGEGSAVLDAEEERTIKRAEITREILDRLVDPVGTPAATYLRSRGITGPI